MSENWGWFHIVLTTYGAWLRGDARGFRTRHHREHVEGDYKNPPPPGAYDTLARYSESLLKQSPVVLPADWRPVVGTAIRERLQGLGAQLLVISVSGQHVHAQAKMPLARVRDWVGLAKKHVWFEARDRGWVGKVFAIGSKRKPIRDHSHQVNTYNYIRRHASQGAWLWTFRDRPASQPATDS